MTPNFQFNNRDDRNDFTVVKSIFYAQFPLKLTWISEVSCEIINIGSSCVIKQLRLRPLYKDNEISSSVWSDSIEEYICTLYMRNPSPRPHLF